MKRHSPIASSSSHPPSSTPTIQAIIFDMDGTIIDTELTASLAIKDRFEEWKIPYKQEDLEYVTGRTWESAFNYLFMRYQFPLSPDEVRTEISTAYRKKLEEALVVVPGSVEAIQALALQYPLGLVSGSYRAEILWAMRKLGIESCFKIILGAEDYDRSKPHPDGFLKALTFLNATPESCLIFEDSVAGIESARTAGAWVIAITSTNHFKQDQSKAHHHIYDLTDVTPEWIRAIPFPLIPKS